VRFSPALRNIRAEPMCCRLDNTGDKIDPDIINASRVLPMFPPRKTGRWPGGAPTYLNWVFSGGCEQFVTAEAMEHYVGVCEKPRLR
jgi:hypothetical protein